MTMPSLETCDTHQTIYKDEVFEIKRLYWKQANYAIYTLYASGLEYTLLPKQCGDMAAVLTDIGRKIDSTGVEKGKSC